MKKLAAAVFTVALLAGAAMSASAYEYTIGGNVGFDYMSNDPLSGDSSSFFTIVPEFAKIIDEDTNVGIGLSYGHGDLMIFARQLGINVPLGISIPIGKVTTIGGYLFAERAVLSAGSFKVFLRGDIGYTYVDIDDVDEHPYWISVGISPNIQYGLTDRLTLIVSSDVLRLGFDYMKVGDENITTFGFNAGKGAITSVGLKYAF